MIYVHWNSNELDISNNRQPDGLQLYGNPI